MNHPSKIDNWEKFEKNISTISLNTLLTKEQEVDQAYISKFNSNCEK